MMESGDYSGAIPRLVHVISKYPTTRPGNEARFWLAAAYYKIKSYREAMELLEEYLGLSPEGRYIEDAGALMAALTEEYDEKFLTPEELDEQIQSVLAKLEAEPGQLAYQLELADLLWKRGNYEQAGALYAQIVEGRPSYADDATVSSRIEWRGSGDYTVLSPAEVLKRDMEQNPLVFMNTASFYSGRDLFTREPRYYAVTGQVYNRSDSILYGVQVIVTLYGFGNMVYDTNTVSLGRMNPGERRAFSVRFGNFDFIENIARYECVGTFQR